MRTRGVLVCVNVLCMCVRYACVHACVWRVIEYVYAHCIRVGRGGYCMRVVCDAYAMPAPGLCIVHCVHLCVCVCAYVLGTVHLCPLPHAHQLHTHTWHAHHICLVCTVHPGIDMHVQTHSTHMHTCSLPADTTPPHVHTSPPPTHDTHGHMTHSRTTSTCTPHSTPRHALPQPPPPPHQRTGRRGGPRPRTGLRRSRV